MSQQTSAVWPKELVIKRGHRTLAVGFDDGTAFEIPFQLLRIESPSAQVQGHSAAQKTIVTGKANVIITRADPVGRYGVRFVFDDGHDSGIYTWDWLFRLGRDQDALISAYQAALQSQ